MLDLFPIALVISGLYLLFRIYIARYTKSFLDILFAVWMTGGILIGLIRRQFPSVFLDNVGKVYLAAGILVLVIYPAIRHWLYLRR